MGIAKAKKYGRVGLDKKKYSTGEHIASYFRQMMSAAIRHQQQITADP